MIKYLISLITTVASFVALLLFGNTAVANPVANSTVTQAPSDTVMEVVNLNVNSPFLQLNNQTAASNFDHLGCSCAVCTQGVIKL